MKNNKNKQPHHASLTAIQAELHQLRSENQQLQSTNQKLRSDNQILTTRCQHYQEQHALLYNQVQELRRHIFGSKSERYRFSEK